MKSFLSKSEKYRPVSNQNVRPNTTNYNNKSSFNQHHNHNQNQDNSSSSSSSNLLARTTTKDNYKIESQPNQFQDNHYHWQNSSNPSESKDTTTTTTGTSAKETVDEDGEIELLFHKCFSNKQWQNAVLYTVVKTSLTNPELKTSIKREGDRNYQGRLHRRLSSGISNFYQLLEVHRAESRKGVDPDLMSLSHVLRYILNNRIMVRRGSDTEKRRRNAICEHSTVDRELVVMVVKKYLLERTLSQYALDC